MIVSADYVRRSMTLKMWYKKTLAGGAKVRLALKLAKYGTGLGATSAVGWVNCLLAEGQIYRWIMSSGLFS